MDTILKPVTGAVKGLSMIVTGGQVDKFGAEDLAKLCVCVLHMLT